MVGILLGYHIPLVLRPCHDDTFQVVGPAYIYDLSDTQALLGLIEDPWLAKIDGFCEWVYLNRETGEMLPEAPRLGPLPDGWEEVSLGRFRARGATESVGKDPRWTAESLEKRGVPLRVFDLV